MTHSEQHKMWWSKDGCGTTLEKPARTTEEHGGKGANESMLQQAQQKRGGKAVGRCEGRARGGVSAVSEESVGGEREREGEAEREEGRNVEGTGK